MSGISKRQGVLRELIRPGLISGNRFFICRYYPSLQFPFSHQAEGSEERLLGTQRNPDQQFDWQVLIPKSTKLHKATMRVRTMRRVREAMKSAWAKQGYQFQGSRHISNPILPNLLEEDQLWGRVQIVCKGEALTASWNELLAAATPVVANLRLVAVGSSRKQNTPIGKGHTGTAEQTRTRKRA